VNPEGSTVGHVPVSIGSPANGLSITSGQVLSLEIGDGLGVDGYGRLEATGGGGGGGGHVIKTNGTPLTQRAGLNFSTQFTVTDDAGNDETDVQMNTNIMATKAYVDGGANSTNAASRLYLFNNY
jgi:hypothetical protein